MFSSKTEKQSNSKSLLSSGDKKGAVPKNALFLTKDGELNYDLLADRIRESNSSENIVNPVSEKIDDHIAENEQGKKVHKGLVTILVILIVTTVIVVITVIIIRSRMPKSSYNSSSKPCKKCRAANLFDNKEGYTGFADTSVLSNGTYRGGTISSTGLIQDPENKIKDILIDQHYKSDTFSRFLPGMNEANVSENMVLAHKINKELGTELMNDNLREDNEQLMKGIVNSGKGYYVRMGANKTTYEPTKTQGIANADHVTGRQNMVNYRNTGYAVPIASYDVDTQKQGYLAEFNTTYDIKNPDSNYNVFASEYLSPTRYDSTVMCGPKLISKPQESYNGEPIKATPIMAQNMTNNPVNHVADNYRNYILN